MNTRFLDVFHDTRNMHVAGDVADGIDINLDRIAQIAIDQHRVVARYLHRVGDVVGQPCFVVDDFHGATTQDVGRADHHWVSDFGGDAYRFVAGTGDPVGRLPKIQLPQKRLEPLPVFRKVDSVGGGAENWHSRGFEIGCDNGEKVRVAFALDCCDREAMGHIATTEGIKGEDVCDLMVTAVEHRFGKVNRLPQTIEWLTDNGSCFIAGPTRRFAREIGLEPLTTPVQSPQSNGMAEAFVRTFKRDYVAVNPIPDAKTVMLALPEWFDHYNELHPHRALGYRSPREFIAAQAAP